MSEVKKWRCPYCDGLNDWQDEVCEICGDGRREEAEAAARAGSGAASSSAFPRAYTPQPRAETDATPTSSPAPKAPGDEPSAPDKGAASTGSDAPTASADAAPKKKKHVFAWLFVLAALAAGAYFLFGEQLGLKPRTADEPGIAIYLTQEDRAAADQISIESVSYSMGTAQIEFKSSLRKQKYAIYTCYLGAEPSRDSMPYGPGMDGDKLLLPGSSFWPIDLNGTQALSVVPDSWCYFLVNAFDDGERGIWWRSEPYEFREVQDISGMPIRITDARFCVWPSFPTRYGYAKRMRIDYDTAGYEPSPYVLPGADALNQALEEGLPLGYDLTLRTRIAESVDAWREAHGITDAPILTTVLTGPDGLNVMAHDYLLNGANGDYDRYVPRDVFNANYTAVRASGGYPAGAYKLDFYIWGVRAWTLRFNLSKAPAGGAASDAAAQATEIPYLTPIATVESLIPTATPTPKPTPKPTPTPTPVPQITLTPEQVNFRLANGSRGEEVRRLQEALVKLGYLNGKVDGIFGKKTEAAVRSAQLSFGLPETGVVDYYEYVLFVATAE